MVEWLNDIDVKKIPRTFQENSIRRQSEKIQKQEK